MVNDQNVYLFLDAEDSPKLSSLLSTSWQKRLKALGQSVERLRTSFVFEAQRVTSEELRMAADEEPPSTPSQKIRNPERSDSESTLEQARRFLKDVTVRDSTREKQIEFLKSKGLNDADVERLMDETSQSEIAAAKDQPKKSAAAPTTETAPEEISSEAKATESPASTPTDRPPIVTYPEFLTRSQRPPPLLTPTRLLHILTTSGAAWTLLYGAARFLVNPMVDTLNESRSDYHTHVNSKLSELVERLEGVVSEVPYKNAKPSKSELDSDTGSSYDDPTELFHRDIGTQTLPQAFPDETSASTSTELPIDVQARRLAQLSSSLKELSDIYTHQAEDSADLKTKLHDVRDDVDKLAIPTTPDYTTLYSGPGFGRSSEPDDEIRKAKDAIRSVKGLFLSSRMFPTAAATAR
jgi:hypothetical protein